MSSDHRGEVGIHFLLLPKCKKTDAGHLDNLEAYTRNITFGFTTTTKTRDEDFVILVNEVEATIILAHQKRLAT